MSRYVLAPRSEEHSHLRIVIGWDDPLNTFFAQVFNPEIDEDDPGYEVLWIGTAYQEIHDMDKVIEALAPWAVVPQDIRSKLREDSD
jgi:hypothetical protein